METTNENGKLDIIFNRGYNSQTQMRFLNKMKLIIDEKENAKWIVNTTIYNLSIH